VEVAEEVEQNSESSLGEGGVEGWCVGERGREGGFIGFGKGRQREDPRKVMHLGMLYEGVWAGGPW
jgi:hypothetical protein